MRTVKNKDLKNESANIGDYAWNLHTKKEYHVNVKKDYQTLNKAKP
jgi:hypothetical protein